MVVLSKFFAPLTRNQLRWGITHQGEILFKYAVEYDEDMTLKDYVNDLKLVLSIDRHWDEYVQQISNFWNKYILPPYIKSGGKTLDGYSIPDDMKIPMLQIYGRKESPGQMHLDFQEKASLNYMVRRLKMIEG